MRYRQLGRTGLKVSEICLGTMTFGQQNSEAEGHAQLNMALEAGVNFIDTAEMYSIPPRAETFGTTERIVGSWLKKSAARGNVILASKVIGQADWLPHIRDGRACLNRANIEEAVEGSLRRLQTDYLDLYQIHWPDRQTNFFGKLGYTYPKQSPSTTLEETLQVFADVVSSGKVRYIGVSNETPWGVMAYLHLSDKLNLPRMVSIQNPYNLLNRSYEIGLAEITRQEQIPLLAYSPLGFGVLTGKYIGQQPASARLSLFSSYLRYSTANGVTATAEYVKLARDYGLSATHMALAFVNSRPFVGSTIVGATTLGQLQENLDSVNIALSAELMEKIERIHQRYPNPCP